MAENTQSPPSAEEVVPASVRKAAEGKKLEPKEEVGALDFLLGDPEPLTYDVEVQLDTPSGQSKLTFVIRQLDGKRILELEKQYRKGAGPFAELDDIAFNAALVAEATVKLRQPNGKEVDVKSPEFRGDVPSPAIALEKKFKYQPGLLDGAAGEVRRISGYSPDRVGSAERSLVNAAGNS